MPRSLRAIILLPLLASGVAAQETEQWPFAPALDRGSAEPGALPPSVTASDDRNGSFQCTFRFQGGAKAESVALVGEFNGWDGRATPLRRSRRGVWSVAITLPPGVYAYKFLLNGSDWIADPANSESVSDGYSGRNSILRLGGIAHGTMPTCALGDGEVAPEGLEHDPASPSYLQHRGGDRTLFRYRTLKNDVESVALGIRGGGLHGLHQALSTKTHTVWETEVSLEGEHHDYTFVLTDGALRARHPNTFTMNRKNDAPFTTPEWAKHAIWYQIMVDRFANGDPTNDPDPVRPWTSEWFAPSSWERASGQSFYKWFVFQRLYGGDIPGLQSRLDYLRELGVNALYLNPIFQSPSHHKYDAVNYLHVDERFGKVGDYEELASREDLLRPETWEWTASDRIFLDFLEKAKASGFRVIIDGVFNHVGDQHPAFLDVKAKGARSKYADWFDVRSWEPFRYEGWAGHGSLPIFRKTEVGFAAESVKRHIFDVTRRWMDPDGDGDPSDGIDGWRLDVPNEVPMPFWAEWREHVKAINPDAYIAGEIWSRAESWLDGNHFDAVMNYPFADSAIAWIGHQERKIPASECDRHLAELRMAYPAEATAVLQNLLDSHDTDRVASMMQNPDRDYDRMNRVQDDNPDYDNSKPSAEAYRRARLLALLQMTYPGAPMIYYGDEVGMWGADDPTNRKPMLWRDLEPYDADEDAVFEEQLAHYKAVIALRNEHPALRIGDFRTLHVDDEEDLWAFLRMDAAEEVVVAITPRMSEVDWRPDGSGWVLAFQCDGGRVWARARTSRSHGDLEGG